MAMPTIANFYSNVTIIDGGTKTPPSTFTDVALTDGYEGEARGYIAGYMMDIKYTIHKVQGGQFDPQKQPSSLSKGYKTGKKTYKGHPKIIKNDELKDFNKA